MAKTLESFTFKHGRNKHPWHEWTDGKVWVIERGVDFTSRTDSMTTLLYDKAQKTQMKVRVQVLDEKTIVFQFQER